jgi:hypothetical protein
MLTFAEWVKMKKSSFKQSKPKGVRDMEDDLSKDFKGHIEKNGTVDPFKIKEAIEYAFRLGDRVRSVQNFQKTGEVTSCVPGDGKNPWYFIRWDSDGSEDRYMADELELE